MWSLLSILALLAAVGFMFHWLLTTGERRVRRRTRLRDPGRCSGCGYSVVGLGDQPRCPECGRDNAEIKEVVRTELEREPVRYVWFLSSVLAVFAGSVVTDRLSAWLGAKPAYLHDGTIMLAVVGAIELILYWRVVVSRFEHRRARLAWLAFLVAVFASTCASVIILWYTGTRGDRFTVAWNALALTAAIFLAMCYSAILGGVRNSEPEDEADDISGR